MKILSLSGGGVRGLISLQALKYIEKRTGRPIASQFDYVIGTSTGAILAAGLGQGIPAAEIERQYITLCTEVFRRRFISMGGLMGPLYDAGPLEHALRDLLGDHPLSASKTAVACVSYSLTARLPVVLGSYNVHSAMPAWQAARASSAAPTFFPPFGEYIDGGLCANNPALFGSIEAAKLYGCDLKDCRVLSIGTGSSEQPIAPGEAAGRGKLGWVEDVINIALDGSQDLVDLQLRELLPAYLTLQIPLSRQPGTASPDMDCVTPDNVTALRQAGQQMVGSALGKLEEFLT